MVKEHSANKIDLHQEVKLKSTIIHIIDHDAFISITSHVIDTYIDIGIRNVQ